MKSLRKWSRILHRDIGYFFIFTTILYGISGIALNHLSDWNPNYSIDIKHFTTKIDLKNASSAKTAVLNLLDEIDNSKNYKSHYYQDASTLKVFLKGGSTVQVNIENGKGFAEYLTKRFVFYEANYLHYNPNRVWTWFSDIFAGALILFALTSLFMVKGKNGIMGRGGIYTIIGIILPILFLWYYL